MFAAIAVAAVLQQDAPASFDADARIREAIAVIRPVAYRSAEVDWAAIEADMRRRAEGATDTVDLLPAYAALTYGLGDGHSFIQPTAEATEGWRARHGSRRLLPDTPPRARATSTFIGREEVTHRALPASATRDAQLIVVPPVQGSGAHTRDYAAALFAATADVSQKTCGYVLDLRGNTGGNVWPMLIGLSGLLGDGPQGGMMDPQGRIEMYAELREGSAVILAEENRGLTMASAANWRPIPALRQAPVALLIDDGVYSSGEGVAVAFRGRAATRFFGQKTGGLASANNGYLLSDGTNLVITVAMMTDRDGATYPHGIEPDQAVAAGDGEAGNPEDAAIEAAQAWLASHPGCGG